MKIAKGIITVAIAMSILMSCGMVNANAITEVGYAGVMPNDTVVVEFSDSPTRSYFDSESFAVTSVTNFGYEDYRTNLKTTTQAYNPNYAVPPTIDTTLYLYTALNIGLSDDTGRATYAETIFSNEPWGRAICFGNNLMPGNAYLTQFLTIHFARVYEYTSEESAPDGIAENMYCIGDKLIHMRYFE